MLWITFDAIERSHDRRHRLRIVAILTLDPVDGKRASFTGSGDESAHEMVAWEILLTGDNLLLGSGRTRNGNKNTHGAENQADTRGSVRNIVPAKLDVSLRINENRSIGVRGKCSKSFQSGDCPETSSFNYPRNSYLGR